MIKTTYQTPELRDSNDNIVQEGAFGKNTALSNSDNTGWIDYVVNNLEALHDTIGDSAAHLDGNGHVVEPANLAIGDEDGNRLKTSYLKLTGGTVSGTLNVAQNLKFQDNQENVFGGVYIPSSSATEQYAQFYGGEGTGVAGAKLTLYPDGDGRFYLTAKSTDGSQTYDLRGDNNGSLYWRGYELAWKKDYLPLSGGTLTGQTTFNTRTKFKSSIDLFEGDTEHGRIYDISNVLRITGGTNTSDGSYIDLSYTGGGTQQFRIVANDGTSQKMLYGDANGVLKWNNYDIALAKDFLPLTGGTITGNLTLTGTASLKNNLTIGSTLTKGAASGQFNNIDFVDAEGVRTGRIRSYVSSGGGMRMSLSAFANEQGNGSDASTLYIEYSGDGVASCYCPTPPNDVSGTRIVTAGWIRTNTLVPSVMSIEDTGYMRLNNNLQILYGTVNATTSAQTVTFAKAFTSAPKITVSASAASNITISNVTATNFAVKGSANATVHYIAIGKATS